MNSASSQVDQIKTTSTNLVVGARDLGVNTVSHAVNMTLETPPGRLVTRTVDFALVQADSLIDKYIPEEEQDDGTYFFIYRDGDFADFFSVLPIFRISADFCGSEL